MQEIYDEFTSRETVVIAIAQEDTDLSSHGLIHQNLKPNPRFEIVADLNEETIEKYDRATAYLIDRQGIVRQVFPMAIQHRPSWWAVINEIKRIDRESPDR